MGAWFLSFAIANLLGGQIAALTGGGHGSDTKWTPTHSALKLPCKKRVKWRRMIPLLLSGNLCPKKLPVNITYQKWFDIKDWVELRGKFRPKSSSE